MVYKFMVSTDRHASAFTLLVMPLNHRFGEELILRSIDFLVMSIALVV